jgi:L-ribulose-5-phosphate 4-epimerase
MIDEGYIKFNAQWKKGEALPSPFLQPLLQARQQLYDLKLIGAYENGIGYGNISRRWNRGRAVCHQRLRYREFGAAPRKAFHPGH